MTHSDYQHSSPAVAADPAGTVAAFWYSYVLLLRGVPVVVVVVLAAVADAAVVPLAAVPDEARLLREVEVVVPDGVVPGFLDAAGVAEPDPVVDAALVYAAAVPPEVVPDAAPPLRRVPAEVVVVLAAVADAAVVVVPYGVVPAAGVVAVPFPLPPLRCRPYHRLDRRVHHRSRQPAALHSRKTVLHSNTLRTLNNQISV